MYLKTWTSDFFYVRVRIVQFVPQTKVHRLLLLIDCSSKHFRVHSGCFPLLFTFPYLQFVANVYLLELVMRGSSSSIELIYDKYIILYVFRVFFNGLWVLLLYRSFLLLLILVTYLLIYFRYILALVHVYYIIHFVGDLVNISDNSLIFNWQPLQNHATYLLTEMKKKVFVTDFIYFLGQNIPFF